MRWAAALALGLVTAKALFAQGPAIDHAGVGCIVADRHPRIEARVTPADVARARVYFRASSTSAWYYVLMKPAAGVLQGALPKPAKATRSISATGNGTSYSGSFTFGTSQGGVAITRQP